MKSARLILLLALALCELRELRVTAGQKILDEEDGRALRRTENLLLRTILKEMEDADAHNDDQTSPPGWVSKRQHPGKRYEEDVEKRQHPGKREEEEDVEDVDYADLQKRQHPGRREEGIELRRRQHPGKRSALELSTDSPQAPYLDDLSKRQHPGKRYLLYNKRQHPGRRDLAGEADATSAAQAEMEKRQHPGKRYWENANPDDPCDLQDPAGCGKAMVLLEMLDTVSGSRAEEKRQHPGRRDARENFALEDLTEQE
ncbi:prothyroliberin precursor-like [Arapaima gigas]